MTTRNNKLSISGATNIYTSQRLQDGADPNFASALVSCHASSPVPLEYRCGDIDTPEEWAELQPGESALLKNSGRPNNMIDIVTVRGVGGTAIGGIEIIEFL